MPLSLLNYQSSTSVRRWGQWPCAYKKGRHPRRENATSQAQEMTPTYNRVRELPSRGGEEGGDDTDFGKHVNRDFFNGTVEELCPITFRLTDLSHLEMNCEE